jgi:hypothetical protein
MGRDPIDARDVRSQIAETFQALARHEYTVTELLEAPPSCLANVKVFDLLRRSPKLSDDGAEKILRLAKVWPLKHLCDLTYEDKQAIIAHLPPRVTELN